MNPSHEELLKLERQGKIEFGIEKAQARKFFYASIPQLEEMVGEKLYVEKWSIRFMQTFSPILFGVSQIFVVISLAWWSIAIIPVLFSWYFFYTGISSIGHKSIFPDVILMLLATAIAAFLNLDIYSKVGVVCFSLSIFSSKATYQMVSYFTLALIARNERAMAFSLGRFVFVREMSPTDSISGKY